MTTRTGKIACLPHLIREQLNLRLHDGETGPELLEWLNNLDEVKTILARNFGGKEINAPNLTAWRQGGYADWVAQGQALELARRLDEEAREFEGEEERSGRRLSELMLGWLTAQFMIEARQPVEGEARWRKLRELCAGMTRIRGMELQERRMRIAEAKLEGPARLRWNDLNDKPREALRKQRVREELRAAAEAQRKAKETRAVSEMEKPSATVQVSSKPVVTEPEKAETIKANAGELSWIKPPADDSPVPGSRFDSGAETASENRPRPEELTSIKAGESPVTAVENRKVAA
ncbi:MAG TPA: hypothetical protein VHH73_16175 [Verrucomicrobiae bacterium]|nr:hypothetical protein [Verrucomicrobiae bacterium]